ncbi:hypothetical protein [Arthrobacter sp. NyZ413]|uniref:hypothetical protein n=1 Tax=Arthrobacter sp. NyZ413 TaxID=3144669 RepID=UPI003BF8F9BF
MDQPQGHPGLRRRNTGWTIVGFSALGLVVFFVVVGSIGAALNSTGSGTAAGPTQGSAVSAAPSAAQARPTPPPAPAVATQTLTGAGDDVQNIDLKGHPAIVAFSCPGCSANTVLKTNGEDSLLVNAIGPCTGRHIIDTRSTSNTTQLIVNANAPWTITVSDVSTVKKSSGPVSGHGDEVIYIADKTSKAAIANTGQSNFAVTVYTDPFPDLAVNEIGSYKGTVALAGPTFVQVESDGDWSITPQ